MHEWPGLTDDTPWVVRFQAAARALSPDLDVRALLLERAAIEGRQYSGAISTGGACRILPSQGGHVVVNLPRQTDWELVPAWLQLGGPVGWEGVTAAVAAMSRETVVARAGLCGVPVAAVNPPATPDEQLIARGQDPVPEPWLTCDGGPASRRPSRPRVVDLSAMWAGPLCGALLAGAGADVTKIESPGRPDPTATAAPEFDRRLNGTKRRMQLPLGSSAGTRQLRSLLAEADVVIESARPRVMSQWGIDPSEFVARGVVWVSITAYGRTGPWSNRPGFGDDTAVAGGLWRPGVAGPEFVGDAAADPVTGVMAALAATEALASGRAALIDVSMREAVAHMVGEDLAT